LKINLHIGQTLPDFLPLTTAVPENQIFHCKISSHRIGNAWQSNRPELGNFLPQDSRHFIPHLRVQEKAGQRPQR